MASLAVSCAERATSDLLIGPDWAINMELCDIINMDSGQAKDVMQVLKRQLGNKNPEVQLLALVVLETMSKNCGDCVFQQIVSGDVLNEMVKLVHRKPDLRVREKILTLIDEWQEAVGGLRGKYPPYYVAYNELKASGVGFPPREGNSVPFFTPPQTQPLLAHTPFENPASLQAHLHSDAHGLSVTELQNARGIADVLLEMLRALNPKTPENLKQEWIVDLVDQCKSYQARVMDLVNNTTDEQLLCQGLALNDNLQRAISLHDDIVKGTHSEGQHAKAPAAPLVSVYRVNDDEDEDDDFAQLTRRSTRDDGHGKNASAAPAMGPPRMMRPFLPPPPPSKNPILKQSAPIDFLSGDSYQYEGSSDPNNPFITGSSHSSNPAPSSSSKTSEPSQDFMGPPVFDEPTLVKDNPIRDQVLEPQEASSAGNGSHPNDHPGSSTSYNSLLDQTQNLSLDPPVPAKQEKVEEDALFRDLLDFGKMKSKPGRP
ncbi:hypothetical protein SAY86_009728 [Trapa natans]|uniref:Target of Myb protein 1 n=1 Tax=Trapa natans TaxID=22666 RepID=A0AAN7KRE3_TRANT|nr:hypothetical protein SAY86_009728 [Trapa natans]